MPKRTDISSILVIGAGPSGSLNLNVRFLEMLG